jgi:hypothetical protein
MAESPGDPGEVPVLCVAARENPAVQRKSLPDRQQGATLLDRRPREILARRDIWATPVRPDMDWAGAACARGSLSL